MHTQKVTPRFLPTLTEVVKPALLPKEAVSTQTANTPDQDAPTEDALVAAVMQRLLPSLELEVERALRHSLQTQLELLLPTVLADVHAAAQGAVRNAVKPMHDAEGN